MTVPARILDLVARFEQNLDAYKEGKYNETQVRREFIDPFFEELGWDIANKKVYAEAYKEVVHEDVVKVGGATKAPDYSFRIGGVCKFFLEAKKPSVNIREDTHPGYQLRRYAWSAKLPLSILTDFEEFAVYDCRVKPGKTDKASHSRVLYMKYSDYPEQWDDIAGKFSREVILKGSFDKYIASKKAKRGTAEVDTAFLEDIEQWRDQLAKNIKCGNSLIGPDFYKGRQMTLLDEEETYRINAFDWQAEFPEIMNKGGFDAVIGNPPYIRIQGMKEWAPIEVEHYKKA